MLAKCRKNAAIFFPNLWERRNWETAEPFDVGEAWALFYSTFFSSKKKIFSNFYFYWHLLQDYIKASINVFSQFLLHLHTCPISPFGTLINVFERYKQWDLPKVAFFFQLLENFAIIQYPWCTYCQYFPKYTGHLRYLGIKRDRTSEEHYINIINRPGSEPRLAHARECQI